MIRRMINTKSNPFHDAKTDTNTSILDDRWWVDEYTDL